MRDGQVSKVRKRRRGTKRKVAIGKAWQGNAGRERFDSERWAWKGLEKKSNAGKERLGSDGSGKSRLGQAYMVWKSKAGTDSLGKVCSGTDWKGGQAMRGGYDLERRGGVWNSRHGLISLIYLLFFSNAQLRLQKNCFYSKRSKSSNSWRTA